MTKDKPDPYPVKPDSPAGEYLHGESEVSAQPTCPLRPPPSTGWFTAVRSKAALQLLKVAPNAFRLAYVIATRAKYSENDFDPYELAIGEALLGDYREYGMTEMQYRLAKQKLCRWRFASFRTTPRGTIGRLLDTRLFALLPPERNTLDNSLRNTHITPAQRAHNGRTTTNKNEKKGEMDKKEKEGGRHSWKTESIDLTK